MGNLNACQEGSREPPCFCASILSFSVAFCESGWLAQDQFLNLLSKGIQTDCEKPELEVTEGKGLAEVHRNLAAEPASLRYPVSPGTLQCMFPSL